MNRLSSRCWHLAGIVLLSTASILRAESVTLDVTVKAVDAKGRTVTVTKGSGAKVSELDVSKKATVVVDGKAAALEAIRPGQKVTITYDSTLEVVSKIEAGAGDGTKPSASTPKGADAGAETESLIADDSLDGWYFAGPPKKPNWVVKNGELSCTELGPALLSDKKYDDFELQVEFRLRKGCNSGIYLRGQYELKLADTPKTGPAIKPETRCGAIYDQIAPSKNAYKGPGQWNTLYVKLEGKTVTVKLNDEVVIDEAEIDGPTVGHLEGKENKPGPFMLRGGGKMDGVTFRNFKVTPLGVE